MGVIKLEQRTPAERRAYAEGWLAAVKAISEQSLTGEVMEADTARTFGKMLLGTVDTEGISWAQAVVDGLGRSQPNDPE